MNFDREIERVKRLIDEEFYPPNISISDVCINDYIWTFDATEEGYLDKVNVAVKKNNSFFDGVAMSAACAIIKHPKRKEALKLATKLLKENGFKEPFPVYAQTEILRPIFYSLIAD